MSLWQNDAMMYFAALMAAASLAYISGAPDENGMAFSAFAHDTSL